MSDRTLSKTALDWAIENADLDVPDTSKVIREDAGARFGVRGLGLVLRSDAELARLMVLLTRHFYDNDQEDAVDDLLDMCHDVNVDNMGKDRTIFIFPGYTLTD